MDSLETRRRYRSESQSTSGDTIFLKKNSIVQKKQSISRCRVFSGFKTKKKILDLKSESSVGKSFLSSIFIVLFDKVSLFSVHEKGSRAQRPTALHGHFSSSSWRDRGRNEQVSVYWMKLQIFRLCNACRG